MDLLPLSPSAGIIGMCTDGLVLPSENRLQECEQSCKTKGQLLQPLKQGQDC